MIPIWVAPLEGIEQKTLLTSSAVFIMKWADETKATVIAFRR
jgi:hypothetical protein